MQDPVRNVRAAGLVGNALEHHEEFVAADARDGVAFAGSTEQPRCRCLQYQVAGLVPERVVDRLEAVQIDEKDRNALLDAQLVRARHAHQRVVEPILEQNPVRQSGQGVGEGTAAQLVVGVLELRIRLFQRMRKAPRHHLQPRLQQRREERAEQQHARSHEHDAGQPGAPERVRAEADRTGRKTRRRHAGVVHAANGDPHQHRRQQLDLRPALPPHPDQQAEDQQRGGRRSDCDQHRKCHHRPVPDDARRHVDGRHAEIVHAGNARTHDQRGDQHALQAVIRPAGHP